MCTHTHTHITHYICNQDYTTKIQNRYSVMKIKKDPHAPWYKQSEGSLKL